MKKCPYCGSAAIKRHGKTALHKPRFQCLQCHKTFLWQIKANKALRQQRWFQLWVCESYSIRQLCQLSCHSVRTLSRIKNYWLEQMPAEQFDYGQIQYLVCDATYFHKDGCLFNLMNAQNQQIISHRYIKKESFKETYPWFVSLRQQGLEPRFITTDGHQSVLRAMRRVWPQVRLQRCLYHIQHEGMRWLRSSPKTEAGQALRTILSRLSQIKTSQERDQFMSSYREWLERYQRVIVSLPRTTVASKDLQRTRVLINNALADMFYYLEDPRVHSTTNALEGFHSRLKADYRRHRGLTKEHRISYLHWYCYFKNKYY